MQRRKFLQSSLSASALALAASENSAMAQAPGGGREYYELRQYKLESGPGVKLTNQYLEEALIPALNRMGMKTIGAFDLYLGSETPILYLLIPSSSLDGLVGAEAKLTQDDEYQKAGAAFLKAPAKEPPYVRVESQLLIAFEGYPKLTVPPVTAQHGSRVFQLRTYESPTNADHRIKVDMFHHGEFSYFANAGFWQVFYGDALIGARMPHLTYMLSFPDLSELKAKWSAFMNDPGWKKLSSMHEYSFEPTVSNIDSLILNPTSYSQI
jgi:hypothetical protein